MTDVRDTVYRCRNARSVLAAVHTDLRLLYDAGNPQVGIDEFYRFVGAYNAVQFILGDFIERLVDWLLDGRDIEGRATEMSQP